MIWTIPNILTFFRILAAPCLALVFAVFDRPQADWIALCLFVIAALTDFFDGWLARKLNQVSEIGKMLDPIADKVMVMVGLMIILANANPMVVGAGYTITLIMIPAAIIGLREVLISGVREYLGEIKLPVTLIAKWKTTAQLIAVGVGFFMCAFEPGVNRAFFAAITMNDAQVLYTSPAEAFHHRVYVYAGIATVVLLWLAALLTLISGWDYFRKGIAYIQEREDQ